MSGGGVWYAGTAPGSAMSSKRSVTPSRQMTIYASGGTTASARRCLKVYVRDGSGTLMSVLPCPITATGQATRLAVFQPAHNLGQTGALAVHEDADPVDAAGNP